MQPTSPSQAPNPALVFALMNAHQQTAALNTAIELDLFRAVGAGPGDVASIAAHCQASERGIAILCDFLVVCGLLQKADGRYQHTPTSAVFLDPASPACLASASRFMANPEIHEVYQRLPEIVRSGTTTLPGQGSVEPDNPIWVSFAENMASLVRITSVEMAKMVLASLNGPIRVLDIAAGHGLFGIAFAQQNPAAQITAVDWPNVLNVAQRNASAAGVANRFTQLPGSAFDVDFGTGFDAVLLTNFLHHFDHATNVTLLRKVHAALRPGGIAATLEFVPDEDRTSPPSAVGFALTMLTSTPAGNAYTFSQLKAMYTEAGFSNITQAPVPMSPETLVTGVA